MFVLDNSLVRSFLQKQYAPSSSFEAARFHRNSVCNYNMSTILLIILVLLLIGAFPAWPYSTGWGYYPSGGIGLILLIVIILAVTGRL